MESVTPGRGTPIPIRRMSWPAGPETQKIDPKSDRYLIEAFRKDGRWIGSADDRYEFGLWFDGDNRGRLRTSTKPAKFDAVILFGEMNPVILDARTRRLAQMKLHELDLIRHIILVGTPVEATSMTDTLVGLGVRRSEISAVGKSINTIDNVYYSMEVLNTMPEAKSVALMTGCYEMERARQAWLRLEESVLPGRNLRLTLLSTQDAISKGRELAMWVMLATNPLQLDMYLGHREFFRGVEERLRSVKGPLYTARRP